VAEPVTVKAREDLKAARLEGAEAERVAAHLRDLADAGSHDLVLDLAGVEFLDSEALGRLVGVQKDLELAGGSLRLAHAGGQPREVLERTGLGAFFGPEG
jgi:anti-sigma B factor antagonist